MTLMGDAPGGAYWFLDRSGKAGGIGFRGVSDIDSAGLGVTVGVSPATGSAERIDFKLISNVVRQSLNFLILRILESNFFFC